jgi:CysZ protein
MSFFSGVVYNLRGLGMGLKAPRLLVMGLIRLAAVIIITIFAASLMLFYHREILGLIWTQPESRWILWVWYLLSWLLSLVLVGLSAVLSYLASQILFSVFIMDQMSRITEKMITGHVVESQKMPWLQQFFHLIRQEIPRATLPVLITLLLTLAGWLTPVGPIVAFISTVLVIIFLSWDNTDLTPARRLESFKKRFKLLLATLPFHLGFGILFLIPGLNILFLSFAPIGGTLFFLDRQKAKIQPAADKQSPGLAL